MKSSIKYIVVAFLIGLLVGGAAGRFLSPGRFYRRMEPEKREEKILNRFTRDLKLSLEQKTDLGAILKKSREEMDKLLAEFRPRFESLRTATMTEIRSKLTPEQQVKFDKIHQEHERRWGKDHPPMPMGSDHP